MRNKVLITLIVSVCSLWTNAQTSLPKLLRNQNTVQLIVNDHPFLILGGELGNSSASSNEYMRTIWPKLKQMNLNTVFVPVYWELMEPTEGQFDFSLIDSLIKNARLNDMKLVLLWFGAWKNSMSCYAPAWIKINETKYPRATDKNGIKQEILTPFSKNNLEADKKAFVNLLQHVKQEDSNENTVIAIQVENEIGMLPDSRTYDEAANIAFKTTVPKELMNYLQKNKSNLFPELDSIWKANSYKTSGTWQEVFGKSLSTDEIFTAWYYSTFANEIAAAGKAVYHLPMYVNAALNRPNRKPGEYPSAGPLPHIMNIWKAGAPAIDILSPDIYFPDFKHWADLYTRNGNPLFIPETGSGATAAAKAFFAFGNYNCLAYSPFSIESSVDPPNDPVAKAYDVLRQLTPLIIKYRPAGNVNGFLLNKDSSAQKLVFGNYRLTVDHEYRLGWFPNAKNDVWPQTGGLLIWVAPDELYVAGTGLVITFESTIPGKRVGFLSIDEGRFENQKWIVGRRMNGDQDHQGRHVRIPGNEYGIQRVKLYTY